MVRGYLHYPSRMWESLQQFWAAHSANIVVSVSVGFIFFVLGPMGLWFSGKRIRRERNGKAREILIDIVEGMIVNQVSLDDARLSTLFEAVERDVGADLDTEYGYEELLGDVALRFERSRHLGREQKQEYYESISRTLVALEEDDESDNRAQLPRRYATILGDLRKVVEDQKLDAAKPLVTELETRLAGSSFTGDPIFSVFRVYKRLYQRSPITFLVSVVIGLAVYIVSLVHVLQRTR